MNPSPQVREGGGGWFNSVVRLRLSQPSTWDWMAGLAELGKRKKEKQNFDMYVQGLLRKCWTKILMRPDFNFQLKNKNLDAPRY